MRFVVAFAEVFVYRNFNGFIKVSSGGCVVFRVMFSYFSMSINGFSRFVDGADISFTELIIGDTNNGFISGTTRRLVNIGGVMNCFYMSMCGIGLIVS